MRLDERERSSCVKDVEVSSSSPFIRISGKSESLRWVCPNIRAKNLMGDIVNFERREVM